MALSRTIHLSFWTDSKIIDDFTPEDRYFYLYLMTNPHTNLCGCYEISMKQMSDETGYTKETIEKLIYRMSRIHRVINFNTDTKEMLLLNWSKYNWTSSDKFKVAVEREIELVKDAEFKTFLTDLYEGKDTVSIPYAYPMDTSYNSITLNTITLNAKTLKKRATFVKPTIEEIQAYCNERNNNIDPEQFFDYYEARGWELSKGRKMKDWKASVRTWEKNNFSKQEKKQSIFDYDFDGVEL